MASNGSESKWLVCKKANPGAAIRLICFPFAGGTASAYKDWGNILPDTLEVHAVQLPGRETRFSEPLIHNFDQLLGTLENVLSSLVAKPYAFFGHSMGALITFELIRRFRARGIPLPRYAIFSGRRSPDKASRFPSMHHLEFDDFVDALRKYGGTPEEVLREKELMQLLVPILKADFSLIEEYIMAEEDPLPIPISVYYGDADPRTDKEEIEGWRNFCAKEIKFKEFEGKHFFIQTNKSRVLDAIKEDLLAIT